MKFLFAIFIIACAVAADTAAPKCPSGFLQFQDKCYTFSDKTATFDDARAACQKLPGNYDLAIVDNKDLNQFLVNNNKRKVRAWIGLHDMSTEGTFTWIDGSPLAYSNWGSGEPNEWRGRSEDCVEIDTRFHDKWNDSPCIKEKKHYICGPTSSKCPDTQRFCELAKEICTDSSKKTSTAEGKQFIQRGCDGGHTNHKRQLVTEDERHSVRCCSEDGSKCTTPANPCHKDDSTYQEALSICSKLGLRLCREGDNLDKLCCGTGCNIDNSNMWIDVPE